MAEELEVLWRKLNFTDEGDEGVELGSSSTKAAKEIGKNCAIMKIMTPRSKPRYTEEKFEDAVENE